MTSPLLSSRSVRGLSSFALGGAMLLALMAPATAAVCHVDNIGYTLTQGDSDAVRGTLCAPGNDMHWSAETELFGLSGWSAAHKIDDPLTASPTVERAGGDAPAFSVAPSPGGTLSWSIENPGRFQDLVVVLKHGPAFGAFLLAGGAPLSGIWGTSGPGGGVNDLSHVTLWFRSSGSQAACIPQQPGGPMIASTGCTGEGGSVETSGGGNVGVVPLPAAGWMLLGGLGLLGGVGWRRGRAARGPRAAGRSGNHVAP